MVLVWEVLKPVRVRKNTNHPTKGGRSKKKKQKTDTLNISKIYIEASPEARDPEDRRKDTKKINAAFDNIPINTRKL